AIPQFLMSNFQGPYLVDVVSGATSIAAVTAFIKLRGPGTPIPVAAVSPLESRSAALAWVPWLLLCVLVFFWGLVPVKKFLNGIFAPQFHVPYLDGVVHRFPPAVVAGH